MLKPAIKIAVSFNHTNNNKCKIDKKGFNDNYNVVLCYVIILCSIKLSKLLGQLDTK